MDFRRIGLQKRSSGLRTGARYASFALGLLVPACNAPSSNGLYSPARPGEAGAGGSASTGGSTSNAGSSFDGGSDDAGSAALDASLGSGGSSGEGGTAGGSSAGGSGGNDPDAGSNAPHVDAGVDAGSTSCGTLRDGICWYLGALDQSCTQTCSSRGGFNAAATAIVGTPAQGGDIENCSALLELLLGNDDDVVVEGTQVAGNGVGCHLFDAQAGQRWWLTTPDFSPDVAVVGAQVVCGCND